MNARSHQGDGNQWLLARSIARHARIWTTIRSKFRHCQRRALEFFMGWVDRATIGGWEGNGGDANLQEVRFDLSM